VKAAGTHVSLETVYRTEARRVLATLIRLLGGFDAAEEALHEAFAAAAEQWPRQGVPANPYSWLVSAGRFRTIDRWRREARLASTLPELSALAEPIAEPAMPEDIGDDELRLIFVCCHPALAPDARIALTLREVGGLTTEEIARAYLTPAPTIAQRIVRAKARIRDEAIPYEVPDRSELPARLESALQVIYLIFNEGYAATQGPSLTRADLCAEAIRLGRLMVQLLDQPEAQGLPGPDVAARVQTRDPGRCERGSRVAGGSGPIVVESKFDCRGRWADQPGARFATRRALHPAGGHCVRPCRIGEHD
jgi:RNA polymerase sigma-70 factor (ECF subfamily)